MSTKVEVADLFSRYGFITEIILPLTPHGTNRGYAFVSFTELTPILKILADLNNLVLRAKLVSSLA